MMNSQEIGNDDHLNANNLPPKKSLDLKLHNLNNIKVDLNKKHNKLLEKQAQVVAALRKQPQKQLIAKVLNQSESSINRNDTSKNEQTIHVDKDQDFVMNLNTYFTNIASNSNSKSITQNECKNRSFIKNEYIGYENHKYNSNLQFSEVDCSQQLFRQYVPSQSLNLQFDPSISIENNQTRPFRIPQERADIVPQIHHQQRPQLESQQNYQEQGRQSIDHQQYNEELQKKMQRRQELIQRIMGQYCQKQNQPSIQYSSLSLQPSPQQYNQPVHSSQELQALNIKDFSTIQKSNRSTVTTRCSSQQKKKPMVKSQNSSITQGTSKNASLKLNKGLLRQLPEELAEKILLLNTASQQSKVSKHFRSLTVNNTPTRQQRSCKSECGIYKKQLITNRSKASHHTRQPTPTCSSLAANRPQSSINKKALSNRYDSTINKKKKGGEEGLRCSVKVRINKGLVELNDLVKFCNNHCKNCRDFNQFVIYQNQKYK